MRRHGRRVDTIDFPALLKWSMLSFGKTHSKKTVAFQQCLSLCPK